jgi:Fungal cellulose binding domain
MFTSRNVFVVPAFLAFAVGACATEVAPSESAENASEAVSSCVPLYSQCGGKGWTGSTCCVSSSCTYSNPWYSQCLSSGNGSSSGSSSSSSSGSGSQSTSCSNDSNDAQERAAATTAFSIMKAAAVACGSATAGPCWGTTILASQRYTYGSGNTTIVFDPADPQYSHVPQAAKAALAIGQIDPTVAAFLVTGLQWARHKTNGKLFPQIMPIAALANFTYPGNSTPIAISDPNVGSKVRTDVVTGSAWCNTERVHFLDTSSNETGFAPINEISYTNFSSAPNPAFNTSGDTWPSTPFNGGNANPYLVVSVNGTTLDWNSKSWPTQTCSGSTKCTATLDLDPIPYAQPGAYYDATGNPVGAQTNPFALVVTSLYADASHAGHWATRTVGGVQQWGTFSDPLNVLGTTVYMYVKQM